MDFRNAKELLELCRQTDLSISEIMRQREIEQGETTGEEADCRMAKAYEIMQQSARTPVNTPGRSMGGLIGGEAKRLSEHQKSGKSMCGSLLGKAMMYAMAVLETNSSMGLIVAAPTAGSAGIVPGLMIAMQEEYGFTDEQMIQALYNAGAIGYLAMRNATVAGAVGGCQAEVGVASAMAASAAAELLGASPEELSGCGIHSSYEYAGTGLRSGWRSGGISLSEQKCCRSGQCTDRSRDVPVRNRTADSTG